MEMKFDVVSVSLSIDYNFSMS